jgi:hypothetical protein
VGDVFLGQQFGQLSLGNAQLVDLVKIIDLQGLDRAVGVLCRMRRSNTRISLASTSLAISAAIRR